MGAFRSCASVERKRIRYRFLTSGGVIAHFGVVSWHAHRGGGDGIERRELVDEVAGIERPEKVRA